MSRSKVSIKLLLITGLVAGTLDGLAAAISYFVQTGQDPLNVYRFIASGVFGPRAFSGGVLLAICGVLIHYIIAFSWTTLFFIVASRFNVILKNWLLAGIAYGIFVWLVMNRVVVPLSLVAMNQGQHDWIEILKGVTILILCIGLPIAYFASKYLKRQY